MQKRYYRLLLFVIVFIGARLIVPPINNTDYLIFIHALHAVTTGHEPFGQGYLMPPWSFIFLLPLSGQVLNVWLALTIALFTTAIVDLGGWSALPLLLHPGLITMVASSNPEWLLVGSGLWLYYRGGNRGWKRGLAWLLLSCKPQTTFVFLIFDGISALRQRDWRAFALSGSVAMVMLALFPTYLPNFNPDVGAGATIFYAYGVPSALLATLIVLAIRWTRRSDWATIGLLLAPIWGIHVYEYSILATGFTVRRGGWVRTSLCVIVCIAAVARFWQVKSYTEAANGMFVMVLAAAVLAPGIDKRFMLIWRQRWLAARETAIWRAPIAEPSELPADRS